MRYECPCPVPPFPLRHSSLTQPVVNAMQGGAGTGADVTAVPTPYLLAARNDGLSKVLSVTCLQDIPLAVVVAIEPKRPGAEDDEAEGKQSPATQFVDGVGLVTSNLIMYVLLQQQTQHVAM